MPFALDRSPFRPFTLVAVALLAIVIIVAGALPASALAADPALATAAAPRRHDAGRSRVSRSTGAATATAWG